MIAAEIVGSYYKNPTKITVLREPRRMAGFPNHQKEKCRFNV